jgi:hypothetical protein
MVLGCRHPWQPPDAKTGSDLDVSRGDSHGTDAYMIKLESRVAAAIYLLQNNDDLVEMAGIVTSPRFRPRIH